MSQVFEPEPIEEQHGFFKQYVKIAGRKARCALCHGKILVDAAYSINNGLICHDACIEETKNLDNNVRRRTLKLMGIGAAFAGATAIGASRLASASGVQQTQITANGVILPSLTSDPANPEPGQMWYRSDAGVTAHFDAIENRVIYSNRIVNGSEVVSAKGIVNGLSVLPNDGQDWGPDTTLGATAKGQYGSPYTQTCGIQEPIDTYRSTGCAINLLVENYKISQPIIMNYAVQPSGAAVPAVPSFSIVGKTYVQSSPSTRLYIGTVIYPSSTYPSGKQMIQYNSDATTTNNIDGSVLHISDVSLYCKSDLNDSNPLLAAGIYALACFSAVIERTVVTYPLGNGIDLENTGSSSDSCIIKECVVYSASNIGIVNTTYEGSLISCTTFGCGSSSNGGSGGFQTGGGFTHMFGCASEAELGNSFMIFGNCEMIACNIDGTPALKALYVSGPVNVIVADCYLAGTSNEPIVYCDATRLVLSNCILDSTLGYPSNFLQVASSGNTVIVDGGEWIGTLATPYTIASGANLKLNHIYGYTPTPTLSTNPPVSATVYQNTNAYDIEIDLPVYATTSGTAGYVTIAKGSSSAPTAIGNQYVNGATSSTSTDIIKLRVPAGWYYSFTASGVTFGTASVFAD